MLIKNTEHPCWVVVRTDQKWHGPFSSREEAHEFCVWKCHNAQSNDEIKAPFQIKETTIGRVLERIEQNSKENSK